MKNLVDFLNEELEKDIINCVFEKHGLFDGCAEQAEYVTNKIINVLIDNKKEDVFIFTEKEISKYVSDIISIKESLLHESFTNKMFYKQLIVKFSLMQDNFPNASATYIPVVDILDEDNMMQFIVIEVNATKYENKYRQKLIELVNKCVSHELTHVYEDYNRIIHGENGIKSILANYDTKKIDTSDMKTYVKHYKDYFISPERNAYISEIASLIHINKKEINNQVKQLLQCKISSSKAVTTIKNLIISDNTFEDIRKWSTNIKKVCDKKSTCDDFCNALKESGLFDSNMKNSNIKQKVIDNIDKFTLKLTQNIYKMLYDAVEETIIRNRS